MKGQCELAWQTGFVVHGRVGVGFGSELPTSIAGRKNLKQRL
jgi:hypothetical protein